MVKTVTLDHGQKTRDRKHRGSQSALAGAGRASVGWRRDHPGARNGKPKAKLVPIAQKKRYVFGAGKGKWKGTERVLDKPLPEEILNAFYQRTIGPLEKDSE